MKLSLLLVIATATAAAAAEQVANDETTELINLLEEESLEGAAVEAGWGRRRRWHNHWPHHHHPHGHAPHGHWPHGHSPHRHHPHHHRPHTHRPHNHRPHTHDPHTHRPHTHRPHTHRPHTHRPHNHNPLLVSNTDFAPVLSGSWTLPGGADCDPSVTGFCTIPHSHSPHSHFNKIVLLAGTPSTGVSAKRQGEITSALERELGLGQQQHGRGNATPRPAGLLESEVNSTSAILGDIARAADVAYGWGQDAVNTIADLGEVEFGFPIEFEGKCEKVFKISKNGKTSALLQQQGVSDIACTAMLWTTVAFSKDDGAGVYFFFDFDYPFGLPIFLELAGSFEVGISGRCAVVASLEYELEQVLFAVPPFVEVGGSFTFSIAFEFGFQGTYSITIPFTFIFSACITLLPSFLVDGCQSDYIDAMKEGVPHVSILGAVLGFTIEQEDIIYFIEPASLIIEIGCQIDLGAYLKIGVSAYGVTFVEGSLRLYAGFEFKYAIHIDLGAALFGGAVLQNAISRCSAGREDEPEWRCSGEIAIYMTVSAVAGFELALSALTFEFEFSENLCEAMFASDASSVLEALGWNGLEISAEISYEFAPYVYTPYVMTDGMLSDVRTRSGWDLLWDARTIINDNLKGSKTPCVGSPDYLFYSAAVMQSDDEITDYVADIDSFTTIFRVFFSAGCDWFYWRPTRGHCGGKRSNFKFGSYRDDECTTDADCSGYIKMGHGSNASKADYISSTGMTGWCAKEGGPSPLVGYCHYVYAPFGSPQFHDGYYGYDVRRCDWRTVQTTAGYNFKMVQDASFCDEFLLNKPTMVGGYASVSEGIVGVTQSGDWHSPLGLDATGWMNSDCCPSFLDGVSWKPKGLPVLKNSGEKYYVGTSTRYTAAAQSYLDAWPMDASTLEWECCFDNQMLNGLNFTQDPTVDEQYGLCVSEKDANAGFFFPVDYKVSRTDKPYMFDKNGDGKWSRDAECPDETWVETYGYAATKGKAQSAANPCCYTIETVSSGTGTGWAYARPTYFPVDLFQECNGNCDGVKNAKCQLPADKLCMQHQLGTGDYDDCFA